MDILNLEGFNLSNNSNNSHLMHECKLSIPPSVSKLPVGIFAPNRSWADYSTCHQGGYLCLPRGPLYIWTPGDQKSKYKKVFWSPVFTRFVPKPKRGGGGAQSVIQAKDVYAQSHSALGSNPSQPANVLGSAATVLAPVCYCAYQPLVIIYKCASTYNI